MRDIRQASSCDCNACVRIPSLDLKFVVHHGQVVRQRIAGREELAGSDVIVVHRLLKADVVERLGVGAYALYTAACVAAMGLHDPAASGLIEHRASYEGIGEIVGWVRDLEAFWQAEVERARVYVEPAAAAVALETFIPAPAAVAWEWLTTPARRLRWQAGITGFEEDSPGGRRGAGTTNHCVHGPEAIVEQILDWRPPDYVTIRMQVPMAGIPPLTMTDVLETVEGGTRVTTRIARPRTAKDRAALDAILPALGELYEAGRATLVPLIEADAAARASGPEEPGLPTGEGRHLRPAPATPVETGAARSSFH
jgi:uncharacterized protein YndB with AHSA1/START domain